MEGGLVDLSLFDGPPTHEHQFAVAEIPAFHSFYEPSLQSDHGHDQVSGQRVAASHTMKPLPPLPRRLCVGFGPDPRRPDGPSRCILQRIKRSRSDNLIERPAYQMNTLQQRRNVYPTPQLTLSAPTQPWNRGRSASPMIWMPDEQMWLILDGDGSDIHHPVVSTAPPAYDVPTHEYARSEPSPRQRDSESSPVRTQLMTLIQRQPNSEGISPLFQEAINGVSMYEYGDPNEPPTFQVERDWRSGPRLNPRRQESWQSTGSDLEPSATDDSYTWKSTEWEFLGQDIYRPRSAN